MLFAYLDEFGHCGPFVHRTDKQYNESPVFGLAGIVLPEASVRPFSARFLKLKDDLFAEDIARANKHAYDWEKKGTEIFRPKAVHRYPALRQLGFRLINTVNNLGGKVFFYGREKIAGNTEGNANVLYTTVFAHTLRRLDKYAHSVGSNFGVVMDQHSSRKELLDCAAKTMYGSQPAKRLVSPPFEVESHFNQGIQGADWIASIVGRLAAYEVLPDQYSDHEQFDLYFGQRIDQIKTHSTIERRRVRKPPILNTQLAEALEPLRRTIRYSVNDR